VKHPEKMASKAAVIKGINALQAHFGDEVTDFNPKVTRDVLNVLCLGYMRRYVKVARAASTTIDPVCTKCNGSKIYQFADGNVGTCYRCKGKGVIDDADRKRNYGYDLHHSHQPSTAEMRAAETAAAEAAFLNQAAATSYDEDELPF
jgi:hypothetical protein